jgi:AcrR family transcriptional regulator
MPRQLPAEVLEVTDGDADAVRRHIMEAAHRVMAGKGLAAASTRAIAEEAGVSAGTLYNYFDGHVQLIAKSIMCHASDLRGAVAGLPARAGRHTVAGNLRYFVRQAAAVLNQLVPAFAAAFSDSALLKALRQEMAAADLANDPARILERYLRAERDLGRVRQGADCRAAAAVIVSLCHDEAFQNHLRGATGPPKARDKEIGLLVLAITSQKGRE